MNSFLEKSFNQVSFDEVVEKTIATLKEGGFGVLNTIDMQKTLKEKINADLNRYLILGACNPSLAFSAIQTESNVGTLLPCSIVIKESDDKSIQVAAINPDVLAQAFSNPSLDAIMDELKTKLTKIFNQL